MMELRKWLQRVTTFNPFQPCMPRRRWERTFLSINHFTLRSNFLNDHYCCRRRIK